MVTTPYRTPTRRWRRKFANPLITIIFFLLFLPSVTHGSTCLALNIHCGRTNSCANGMCCSQWGVSRYLDSIIWLVLYNLRQNNLTPHTHVSIYFVVNHNFHIYFGSTYLHHSIVDYPNSTVVTVVRMDHATTDLPHLHQLPPLIPIKKAIRVSSPT